MSHNDSPESSARQAFEAQAATLPAVPLTVDGASLLHQMMRFRWAEWRILTRDEQNEVMEEATAFFSMIEGKPESSAIYSMLGHKGDLMFVHFRQNFEELNAIELGLSRLAINDFLEPTTSYLSIVELGLYESTVKTYGALAAKGIEPFSDEWNASIGETLNRQREAMKPRLYPEIPPTKYICFYPMDRKRGEMKNWYSVPMAERQRMMHEHGLVGRRYAGEVKQVISGSIGLDDWEWGVDLFAEDPAVFKKLIYEMRFDEVSAVYALFGSFYVGIRVPTMDFPKLILGDQAKGFI
jgi:hydrogen peroxide-dependent heme synthase